MSIEKIDLEHMNVSGYHRLRLALAHDYLRATVQRGPVGNPRHAAEDADKLAEALLESLGICHPDELPI